jgi:GNAT superfamily N-acetyltransferase
MANAIAVRPAEVGDITAIAAAMARAFEHDPLVAWLLPDDRRRLHRAARLFAVGLAKMALPHHHVLTTEERTGVADWAAPGRWQLRLREMLPAVPGGVRALGVVGGLRFLRTQTILDRRHPAEPHWYLAGLGTDPPYQGKGIGSALMRPVLDRCDSEGLPAYLETAGTEPPLLCSSRVHRDRPTRPSRRRPAHLAHVARPHQLIALLGSPDARGSPPSCAKRRP